MPKNSKIVEQGAMQLRAADHRILRELGRDGRLSNVELARRVRMSESACLRRVRALEESGAISGYRATINPLAFGKVLSAYMLVNLDQRGAADASAFLQVMRDDDRIITCAAVEASDRARCRHLPVAAKVQGGRRGWILTRRRASLR
jgi:DNA-binding Lrp family transcriptional regulator